MAAAHTFRRVPSRCQNSLYYAWGWCLVDDSVDAVRTFPLVARFEEVWVVDDGARLQVRGT